MALEELKGWAAQSGLCGGRAAQAAAAVLRAGDREQGSFFTTLARNLDWLASEPMREFLSASDVDLEELLDGRLDLYLVVPLDLVAQQANFLRLLTNLVLGTVIRQDGRRQLRERLLLVLDELTRLGPMTQLMNIATVAAGSGLEALFVAQDKGSLDAVWGPAGAGTLLGSCATVRVFGLGRTDGVTAQWAEQQLGHRTLYTHSRRTGGLGAVGAHDGQRSEVRDRLLTAAQIQELPPERMLCFLRAHPARLTAAAVPNCGEAVPVPPHLEGTGW